MQSSLLMQSDENLSKNLCPLKPVIVSNFDAETHANPFTNTFQHLGFDKVFDFMIDQT